jgi:tetratricopeptide (TPR) repeat protein
MAEPPAGTRHIFSQEGMMKEDNWINRVLLVALGTCLLLTIGCAKTRDEGKIPITTTSETAREYYLQGRDLYEKIRLQQSIQFFEKAIEEDPDFALAHLVLSFVQPSTKAFFESLGRATALADRVSEGERLWILGVEAGVNGFPMKQRELFIQMVEAYPQDERAYNILGNHYFGQQEYALAIEAYEKAAEIAPDFSAPYNMSGYAHRFLEDYDSAEKAFWKYIDLIPDDPNPQDSYAELLMKMGKYNKSIETYLKALSLQPDFVPSRVGMATDLNFLGKHEAARKVLQALYNDAHNDGERRAAHFAMAVSYADEGDLDMAMEELGKRHELAAKINDAAAMSGDMILMGNILYELEQYDEALAKYERAVEVVQESDLAQEVKDNTDLNFLYNAATVAVKRKDFAAAKAGAAEHLEGAEAADNPNQIRLAHQLMGMIALEEGNYEEAIEELGQASQQNPYNIYRLALAYQGKGDMQKGRECCERAANFNALNSLNYAFIREKARHLIDSM